MSKLIYLYIFNKDSYSIKRFDGIEISQESLNRVLNDPEAEVMSIQSYFSPNNYILKDILNIRSLWISRNEGEVISTSKNNIWFAQPNDALAIQKFLEYEIDSLHNALKAYEKTVKRFSKCIKYLQSHIEGSTSIEKHLSLVSAR